MKNDIHEIAPGLRDAAQPLPDVATAGQPEAEHIERLAGAGYKTVIDLRGPDEDRGLAEAEATRRAGMEYVNIPVGHDDVDDVTFGRFLALMDDRKRRPVLVHCSSANRVGALLIPYLLGEGQSLEDALATARRVGLRSDRLQRAALRYAAR